MEIVRIFANQLTSFQYDTEQSDEFTRLFRQWQDPVFLYEFFTEHIEDLQSGFFGTVSLQTAISQTRQEARRLELALMQLAKPSNTKLDSIFVPLKSDEPLELTRTKAKGHNQKSWLRIYAIKLESNVYIVTGGAIKLTRSMQDGEHTKRELQKFERCKDFLREKGIIDIEGLKELSI